MLRDGHRREGSGYLGTFSQSPSRLERQERLGVVHAYKEGARERERERERERVRESENAGEMARKQENENAGETETEEGF